MRLLEPDVALTDFALAVECALFAIWIYRKALDGNRLRGWFLLFFTTVGAGAGLGGVAHAFFQNTETTAYTVIWGATLLAIGTAALSCWSLGGHLIFSQTAAKWMFVLASVLFSLYAASVLFFTRSYTAAIIHYLPAGAFLIVAFIIAYARWHRTYLLPGIAGLVLSFAAAGIQQAGVRLPALGLSHNALYHVLQFIAMLLVFVSARGLIRDPEFENPPTHRTALFPRSRFAYVAALLAMVSVLTFYLGYAYGRQVVRIVVATVVPEKYGGGELSRFVRQEKYNSKVVVFVHGVTGTPTSTWTFKGNGVSAYWPKIVEQDPNLNGYDIFVMSYYSPQLQEGPGIFQLADSLYKELVERGIYPDKNGVGVYKEVIFVCHSMANLILRNMMITNPLPSNSSTSVPLVLSIASPSAGSALAELVANIADNTVYQEMAKAEKNSYLQLLNGVWKKASFDTEIACAFERKEYAPLGKRVVDETSATSVCTRENAMGIDEDHITIVKPPSKDHDIHKWLVKEIRRPVQKRAWELDRWVNNEIIVAGKDFPESNMHTAMIAAVVRAHLPDIKVTVKYDVGNASRLFSALLDRRIDIYAEYDGSLLHEYLRRPLPGEPGAPPVGDIVETMNRELEKELQTLTLKYLPHFGFDDPYVLVMLRAKAQELGIVGPEGRVRASNLAAVAAELVLLSDQEFFGRNEWAALKDKYQLGAMKTDFAQHTGIYERLRASKPQQAGAIIVGFGSDAELHEFNDDITIIEDDKKVLPNYYPAPLVDKRLLRRFPGLEEALRKLGGTITLKEMSGLLATYKARLSDTSSPGDARITLEKVVADFMNKKRIPNKPPGL